MKSLAVLLFLALFLPMAQAQEQINVTVRRTIPLMGSQFEITVVAQNEEIGYINIQEAAAEIERIEKLISSWDPKSQTSSINRNAGIRPVKVSEELFKLIERAVQISEITYGAFDISYAALDQLWRFDGSMKYLPSSAEVKRTVDKVGYKKIVLKPGENTVYLKEKGMRIGFGAIGKGYAADKAKELLVSKQVPAGMINAAGDITTWGAKATGEKWLIGVDNPTGQGVFFSWLPLVESSVAITGNHSNYVTLDGKRYTHVINPKTGYPAMGLKKVTVLAKSAELCDALSTAVYVMGKKLGLALINQLDGTEVVILDDNDEVYKSNGILP
ncbi:FAD:protein FMN transferase [Muriicola sp. Z0-33]|uniref:FAD:protein FMN transferase n=1 Tax=Muriicola sp. Z0-33 TaxID=2816957 RepID=UPI002237F5CB|nr:FAD:protein FMN transferase [Muriicola sp. Z0-33]